MEAWSGVEIRSEELLEGLDSGTSVQVAGVVVRPQMPCRDLSSWAFHRTRRLRSSALPSSRA